MIINRDQNRILFNMSEEEAGKLKWVLGWEVQIPAFWASRGMDKDASLYKEVSSAIWDRLDELGVQGHGLSWERIQEEEERNDDR